MNPQMFAQAQEHIREAIARRVYDDQRREMFDARAFKELEELKLRLKMKPAPKPVDVSVPKRNGRARAAAEFQEQPASPKPDTKPG